MIPIESAVKWHKVVNVKDASQFHLRISYTLHVVEYYSYHYPFYPAFQFFSFFCVFCEAGFMSSRYNVYSRKKGDVMLASFSRGLVGKKLKMRMIFPPFWKIRDHFTSFVGVRPRRTAYLHHQFQLTTQLTESSLRNIFWNCYILRRMLGWSRQILIPHTRGRKMRSIRCQISSRTKWWECARNTGSLFLCDT